MSDLVWFLDRNLGRHDVADALRNVGAQVKIHDEHFKPDALDETWLPVVGREQWLLITRDERIRWRPAERLALETAQVGAFVVTAHKLTGAELGELLASALPAMTRKAHQLARPFIVTVSVGRVLKVITGERRGGVRRDR